MKLFAKFKNKLARAKLASAKGFTIMEMMVAITIFLFLLVSGMTAVQSGLASFRQSLAQVTSVNTISFVMESLTRQIATGLSFSCDTGDLYNCQNFANPSDDLYFIDQKGRSVKYFLASDGNGNKWIARRIYDPNYDTVIEESLTSPKLIRFDNPDDGVFFLVTGSGSGDLRQALIYVRIRGSSRYYDSFRAFDVETMIVPRRLGI